MAICKSKKAPEDLEDQSLRGGSKMSVQQGHSPFGARSVLPGREHGKRATCLREAAPAKAGNAAGGFFQQPHKQNQTTCICSDTLGTKKVIDLSLERINYEY